MTRWLSGKNGWLHDWMVGCLAEQMIGYLIDRQTGWLADWSIDWLSYRMTDHDALDNWLSDRLNDWLSDPPDNWLAKGMTGSLTGWLDDLLAGCLLIWLTICSTRKKTTNKPIFTFSPFKLGLCIFASIIDDKGSSIKIEPSLGTDLLITAFVHQDSIWQNKLGIFPLASSAINQLRSIRSRTGWPSLWNYAQVTRALNLSGSRGRCWRKTKVNKTKNCFFSHCIHILIPPS